MLEEVCIFKWGENATTPNDPVPEIECGADAICECQFESIILKVSHAGNSRKHVWHYSTTG